MLILCVEVCLVLLKALLSCVVMLLSYVLKSWTLFLRFICVQDAEKYKLDHPSHFHYLNQSRRYELDGVSSLEEYLKTRRAMDIVGISDEEQVLKTLHSMVSMIA